MREVIYISKKYLKNRHYLSGRTSRRDFWIGFIGTTVLGLVLLGLLFAAMFLLANVSINTNMDTNLENVFLGIIVLPFLIYFAEGAWAFIAAEIRRLHDSGLHGVLILLNLIFPVGTIVLLILLCRDSGVDNVYGNLNEQI